MTANPYFDSEMWEERRNEAALYIQRLARGWFARKLAKKIRNYKKEQEDNKHKRNE